MGSRSSPFSPGCCCPPSRAKAKAQGIKCTSNEKQIALGYLLYAGDHSITYLWPAMKYPRDPVGLPPIVGSRRYPLHFQSRSGFQGIHQSCGENKVVACPVARIGTNVIPSNIPGYDGYGGYGHNYAYLGYMQMDHVKSTTVTKPSETCMNGDGLDPNKGLSWWNYGYLYPPSLGVPLFRYVRHGKGRQLRLIDGHVSAMAWKAMAAGQNGKVDWYYQAKP